MEQFDDYQLVSSKFRVDGTSAEERVMGLLEEAGEVAGVFKRLLRGDYSDDVAATKLHKELGNILWYLGQVALDNGWKLSEVAKANVEKLESRQFRGLIMGSGSDR